MRTGLHLLLAVLVAGAVYWLGFYQTPEEKHFQAVAAAARQDDVSAQVELGDLYAQGKGTASDGEQALAWYRKAALAGDAVALWKCAQTYIQGQLVPQDLEEAVPFLLLAAKQQQAPSRRELSRFYRQGLGGLPRHEGESLFWLFAAARAEDTAAREELAARQTNDPELYAQVQQFLTDLSAAQEGDGPARFRVGQAYRTGKPVLQNGEDAARWLTLAWEENKLPQAGLALAQLYQDGANGLEPDAARAATLWNELVRQAYAPAQYALGEAAYKSDPPKYDEAYAWFSNAASGGYAPGQYMTGFMLMQGQGVAVAVPLAITFFRAAAEQDYPSAQYVLGQIYWKGLGVPADKKAGRKWLELAAAQGVTAAQELLAAQ